MVVLQPTALFFAGVFGSWAPVYLTAIEGFLFANKKTLRAKVGDDLLAQVFQTEDQQMSILLLILLMVVPSVSFAYVGPGAGLSAIGAFLALVIGIVLAIFGFLWYPIKRWLRRKAALKPD